MEGNYETGHRNPSSSVINNICKTFSVSEEWLRTGEGEMLNAKSSAAMEALARERGLTHSDYVLIEKFLNLKPQSRVAVAEYMLEVAAALNSSSTPLATMAAKKSPDIATEVGHYRSDLIMDEQISATKLHAELDRQIAEEKKRVDKQSASGRGNSEKGIG